MKHSFAFMYNPALFAQRKLKKTILFNKKPLLE